MTCIAAVSEKGKVYIGADSAGVAGMDVTIRADEKIFKNGECLFGFTSSFRMGQLLRYKFEIPDKPRRISNKVFINTFFIDGIRKCLKDGGYSEITNNKEKGGCFIVGYKGNIYQIASDFQVVQSVELFDTCGSGEDYAKAVLYITKNRKMTPRDRIYKALQTAEYFNAGIRKPFRFLSV